VRPIFVYIDAKDRVIEERKGGGAMAIVGRVVGAAAGAEMLTSTGERPATRGRSSPRTKRALMVAVALLALAVLISASEAPNNAKHYFSSSSAGTTADKSGAGTPVSQPAAPRMSEEEVLEAYEKLPLSFIPNKGQTDEAVRYYAEGAGYGFFFTKGGATLSFADAKGRGHALGLDFLGADPHPTLEAQQRLAGNVNYLIGDDPTKWRQGLPTHGELLYGGLWPGIDMALRGEGGKLKYEFHLKPGASVEDVRLAYRGAEGLSVGAGGSFWCGPPRGSKGHGAGELPADRGQAGGCGEPLQAAWGGWGRLWVCGGLVRPSLPAGH
jgi:hypothetical protein